MPFKEVSMWEILEILRRHHRNESQRVIQAATGKARKTQRRYTRTARKLGWDPTQEPTEELAQQVLENVQPGPREAGPGASEERLLPHLEQIKEWIEGKNGKDGLTVVKTHDLLSRRNIVVPYSSLHRFVVAHCNFGGKGFTVRMPDTAPGEYAEIDFGRLGLVPDPETGRNRVAHALIVTLVYSRHMYVHVTFSQKFKDLVDGMEDAWEFFDGVTKLAILDNLKAAVLKADRYDPIFQRVFEEYAKYRDFVIDPTVSKHPKGKPHVERAVPYVRKNFFQGETWLNIEHVQREAVLWCLNKAGKRIHGTTRWQPLKVFEEEEKATLKALEKDRYDPPRWATCKVHPDHHIRISYALYSIPHKYLGNKVDVREDSRIVRVYFRGRLIKTHPRKGKGERSTDYDDYPKELNNYTMRDPNRMIWLAGKIGECAKTFTERLLAPPFPWAKLRQANMLMGLAKKFGDQRVDAACRRALDYDQVNTFTVKSIIKQNLDNQTKGEQGRLFPAPARFLRPAKSFSHSNRSGETTC